MGVPTTGNAATPGGTACVASEILPSTSSRNGMPTAVPLKSKTPVGLPRADSTYLYRREQSPDGSLIHGFTAVQSYGSADIDFQVGRSIAQS